MTTPISLTDPDATFGDDSQFTAGLLAQDSGTGDDSGFRRGPVITDSGTGADASPGVTVAVSLADTATGDDLPWEYISAGTPTFPYYADLPSPALNRIHAGDQFLWYAGS